MPYITSQPSVEVDLPVHSPRNQFNEEDPRARYPSQDAPTAQNEELYQLRKAVLVEGRAIPTAHEVKRINASAEEQLKELWVDCYVNRIEPSVGVRLGSMTPLRRALVRKWRRFFVVMNVDLYRFKAQCQNIDLSEDICEAWEDIVAVEEDDYLRYNPSLNMAET